MSQKSALILLSLLAFFALNSNSYADIDPATIPIEGFREVTPDIYRGARPSAEALQDLAKEGLKTIIDLEDNPSAISNEAQMAQTAGLQFISKPLSSKKQVVPSEEQMNEIHALLEDLSNYPVYVHCHLGEDRTGIVIALYRVFDQHWSAAEAYQEALQDGFHTFMTGLKSYYDQKTAGH